MNPGRSAANAGNREAYSITPVGDGVLVPSIGGRHYQRRKALRRAWPT
jgi:hypothetical protein